jgi:hypothetical protein
MQEHNNGILDQHKIIGQTKKLYILHLNDLYLFFHNYQLKSFTLQLRMFKFSNFSKCKIIHYAQQNTLIFSLYSKSYRPSQNNFLAFILFKYIYIHT